MKHSGAFFKDSITRRYGFDGMNKIIFINKKKNVLLSIIVS